MSAAMFQYGQVITFGTNGLAKQIRCSGISIDESPDYSWTNECLVNFEIKLPIPRSEIALEIVAQPFIHEARAPRQEMSVYFNGLFQGFDIFTNHKTVRFDLMRSAFSPRANRLSLVIPTALSPKDAGLGSDVRLLGLALTSFTFVAA